MLRLSFQLIHHINKVEFHIDAFHQLFQLIKPSEKGNALAALISDKSCAHISGAGHLIQEDRPEAIAGAILNQIGTNNSS